MVRNVVSAMWMMVRSWTRQDWSSRKGVGRRAELNARPGDQPLGEPRTKNSEEITNTEE